MTKTKKARILREVPFATFLAYSSRGWSEISQESREMRDAVKHDGVWPPAQRRRFIDLSARWLRDENEENGTFREFFGKRVFLVPAPGCSPGSGTQSTRRICQALVRYSLAKRSAECLERVEWVPKSAYARTLWDRPPVEEHVRTTRCVHALRSTVRRITVVDDFLTTGTSLVAFTSVLQHTYRDATITAFALVRSCRGNIHDMERPLRGILTCSGAGYADVEYRW